MLMKVVGFLIGVCIAIAVLMAISIPFDKYKWFRQLLFAAHCIEALGLSISISAAAYMIGINILLCVLLFLILLPVLLLPEWCFMCFVLDVCSEIRYSFWSHRVTKQYARLNPTPKAVAVVDDASYTVPLIVLSAVLVCELVACVVWL